MPSHLAFSRPRFHLALLLILVGLVPGARAIAATTIDVLFVYDTTATTWVGSHGGMTAFSEDVINRMNLAMQNSGVDLNFRAVHSMSVTYRTQATAGGSLEYDLRALQAGSGGLSGVASARDTYGADLVAMLVDHGSAYGYVGIGWVLNSFSGNPSASATVSAIRSVDIAHTLTHEVGHNLGAGHSRTQSLGPGPSPLANYAAGYYFTGTNGVDYHSIMSYNDDGTQHYESAPLFSTPLKTYQGGTAGVANSADNARVLRETKDAVAAYRTAKTPVSYAVTLTKAGAGAGTVSGGGNYAAGATVNLTATPASGSRFAGWSASPCASSFAMPAQAITCTATFTAAPSLRVNDLVKAEGNSGATAATFTVTLSSASTGTVTVRYSTANGTALAGSDYTTAIGTLTFSPGQTSKTVTVNASGDTAVESNETFSLNLSSASGATIADSQGLATLLNDDGPRLWVSDVSKGEGSSGNVPMTFTVNLTPASAGTVTANFATANGTATAGSDYTAISGSLTFSPGQTSKTVTVYLRGDTTREENETFLFNLSGVSGATLFDGQAVGTILNDEGSVLRVSDVSKAEGNSGTTAATFTVTLSPASSGTVTVNYGTASGTATAGSDFTATSGTLTFSPGQTSKTVRVNVTGDTTGEANETFVLKLIGSAGATLFDGLGLGTILNDDGPALRINDVSRAEGNSGETAFSFTATLSQASAGTVRVGFATANGTAIVGSDYTAGAGTLTFNPGETSKAFSVRVTGETTVEYNESFFVNLSQPVGATLFDAQGLGTIVNDD